MVGVSEWALTKNPTKGQPVLLVVAARKAASYQEEAGNVGESTREGRNQIMICWRFTFILFS